MVFSGFDLFSRLISPETSVQITHKEGVHSGEYLLV